MTEELQPYITVDHTNEVGWRWSGYNGVDPIAQWGHGYLTKGMATEAGARWLDEQRALLKRKTKRAIKREAKNGEAKRGNARKQRT